MTGIFPTQDTPGDPEEFNDVDRRQLEALQEKCARWHEKRFKPVEQIVRKIWPMLCVAEVTSDLINHATEIVEGLSPFAEKKDLKFMRVSNGHVEYWQSLNEVVNALLPTEDEEHRFRVAKWRPGAYMQLSDCSYIIAFKE